jgi:putative phosphoribosyl transferase
MRLFRNRQAAGQQLAAKVAAGCSMQEGPFLVIALPRGGVPVAYEIAEMLHAPLDVLVVRKLGVPSHSELAFGAVAGGDVRVLNQDVVDEWWIPNAIVQAITAHEMEEVKRRERLFRGERAPLDVRGRNVILVDDGIATGATILAAVKALSQQQPARLSVAVPVTPTEICEKLRTQVDGLFCLQESDWFVAVGSWYMDFSQVSDEEVRALLDKAQRLVAANSS